MSTATLLQSSATLRRSAKLGIGVNVTDASTERRYHADVDGPAQSSLALPLRSGGLEGDILAVLSVRKLGKGGEAAGPKAPGTRLVKPTGFTRDEEVFIRTLAAATGPFLYLVLTLDAIKRQSEHEVAQLEVMAQVPRCSCRNHMFSEILHMKGVISRSCSTKNEPCLPMLMLCHWRYHWHVAATHTGWWCERLKPTYALVPAI
jgi:hypothetical protein